MLVKSPTAILFACASFTCLFQYGWVAACSDLLVTPKASVDGAAMIAYNADDLSLYGMLYHYPPSKNMGGQNLSVYDWDTGVRQTFDLFLPAYDYEFSETALISVSLDFLESLSACTFRNTWAPSPKQTKHTMLLEIPTNMVL